MSMPEFVATVHATGVHDARQHLTAFERDHPAWWERHLNSEALYAIPERAVQSHSLVTLFNQADLAAERDFARRCRLALPHNSSSRAFCPTIRRAASEMAPTYRTVFERDVRCVLRPD